MTEINLAEVKEQVKKAIVLLAGVCDGAYRKDNVGFNAFDADFGADLADWIMSGKSLTDGQFKAAWKMAKFYHRQIPFEIPAFKASYFEKTNGTNQPYIEVVGDLIHIVFGKRPSTSDRDKLDTLPFRRWEPNFKDLPWLANATDAAKINQLFGGRPDWKYSPEFLRLTEDAPTARPKKSGPRITFEDGMIRFYFGFAIAKGNPLRTKIDTITRKWMPDLPNKPWESPLTEIEKVKELFSDCDFTQDFNAEYQKFQTLKGMSRAAESDFNVPGMKTSLLPFQRAGVEMVELSNGRCLIGDEMGLGKTAQALAYCQLHLEMRPAILVVPASLKINWMREINKFMTSDEKVVILAGRTPDPEKVKDAGILIINYEILSAWVDTLAALKPQILVVDEAHKIKNPKAQRTQAVDVLAKIAKAYIPMTGTPIRNRPMELWTHLNMIDPSAWGNWYQYATTYNSFVRGFGLGAPRNLPELHEKIKPYMVRRTKQEVMKELPPILRTTIVLEFDAAERKLHDDFLIEAEKVTGMHHLAMIEKAKQAAARGKMKACIDWITEFLESGEKLVVYGTHRDITGMLYDAFADQAVLVRGGVSQKKRQEAVDRFQNDESVRLFVGNVEAAGVGLTLTAASNVAIVEFPWTPDTVEQAIARCHRIGQLDSVTAWHLVAEKTIEEDIVDLLQFKAEVIHRVIDGEHTEKEFSILSELSKIIHARTENIKETINGNGKS